MQQSSVQNGRKRLDHNKTEHLVARVIDFYQRGAFAEAEALCRQILAGNKDQFEALHFLGLLEAQRGNLAEAHRLFGRTVKLNRRSVEARINLGRVLGLLNRHDEALTSYDEALAIDPNHVLALNNRGSTLRTLGRPEEALASFDKALAMRPDYVDALYNRGNALAALQRNEQALASYDQALALRRDDIKILIARGNALLGLQRLADSLASFDRALALRPRDVMALYNRGNVLSLLRRYREAADCYRKALEIEPNHRYAFSGLADCAMFTCDWSDARLSGQVQARVQNRTSIVHPFTFLGYCDDPSLQLQCAKAFIDDKFPTPIAPARETRRSRRGRIRIAYVSADFRNHAMSYLTCELFELHDRARFEVHGVSLEKDDGSPIRARLVDAFDAFHDVHSKTDLEIANLLRALEVDIAIDLTGHTRGGRIGIFAHRAAPIQASYLGFPGTSGAPFIDYIVADEIVVPTGRDSCYTEKVVRLPGCYWVDNRTRTSAEQIPTRHQAGLPDEGFVFCCFNNNYKITPPVFDIWMRLLRAVDASVLWLVKDNDHAEANLRREAVARGIDASRLVFRDRLNLANHLAHHPLADLFLDTVPVNAHTTATDALWMGLPLLTCAGQSFAGRVAASLLHAAGLPELVTHDLAAYETLALKLASEPALLQSFRARLQKDRLHSALFDTDRFRRRLETAFLTMWDVWQRGEDARSFSVEDSAPAALP